jgi:hypothetical protein
MQKFLFGSLFSRRLVIGLVFFSLHIVLSVGGAEATEDVVQNTAVRKVKILSTTRGVNHEFVDPARHPDFVATTQLSLSFDALVGPDRTPLNLKSDLLSARAGSICTGPCNLRTMEHLVNGTEKSTHEFINCSFGEDRSALCDLNILRFAQFGHVDGPVPVQWLVTMPDSEESLRGKMRTTLNADGTLKYPADVELAGHMIVTVRVGDGDPIRLLSRKKPVFRGQSPGWPPHGAALELENPPIEYFVDKTIDDPEAKPFMVVTANAVRLGDSPSEFFSVVPEIETARRLQEGGVQITWKDVVATAKSVQIAHCYVYRNRQPGHLESWEKIATLSASQTAYVDHDVDGTSAAEYAISYTVNYPFGYEYEGTISQPRQP